MPPTVELLGDEDDEYFKQDEALQRLNAAEQAKGLEHKRGRRIIGKRSGKSPNKVETRIQKAAREAEEKLKRQEK